MYCAGSLADVVMHVYVAKSMMVCAFAVGNCRQL